MGVPEIEITSHYIPLYKSTVDSIDWWFTLVVYHDVHKPILLRDLRSRVEGLKTLTDRFVTGYLRDINMIVLGDGNRAIGKKIFLNGNNMNVQGNNAYVYNSNYNNNTVRGNNIIRTAKYEFNLD